MNKERLFGALASLWLIFFAMVAILSALFSSRGFSLPVFRLDRPASLILSLLLYVPPLICALIWLTQSGRYPAVSRMTAAFGWPLVLILGMLLLALLLLPMASTLFLR